MLRRIILKLVALAPSTVLAQKRPIARLAAASDGQLTLEGKPISITQLDEALAALRQRQGVVWYYRQSPKTEPHPNAMAAIELVVKHQLPVSMSTKADFSDYVDENGQAKPRR